MEQCFQQILNGCPFIHYIRPISGIVTEVTPLSALRQPSISRGFERCLLKKIRLHNTALGYNKTSLFVELSGPLNHVVYHTKKSSVSFFHSLFYEVQFRTF